jgi:chromosome segregation ATPase
MSEQLAAQIQTLQADLSAATAERETLRRELAERLAAVHAEMKEQIAKRESQEEELRSLRAKLDAEVQAHRLAQEKISQLQQEMAGYRQIAENPAALREAEKHLAKRVGELVVAQEQVRRLTGELDAARAANLQQNERVDQLRRVATDLKEKRDALADSARAAAQEQAQLQTRLREETARRQAAEAEVERLRQGRPRARRAKAEPGVTDAETLAELRSEVQAALRAAGLHRSGAAAAIQPVGSRKAGLPGVPSRKQRTS